MGRINIDGLLILYCILLRNGSRKNVNKCFHGNGKQVGRMVRVYLFNRWSTWDSQLKFEL